MPADVHIAKAPGGPANSSGGGEASGSEDPRQRTFEFGFRLSTCASPIATSSNGTPASTSSFERKDDRGASSCQKSHAIGDALVGGMQSHASEATWTSPSVDLILKVEKAERRLHEIVVAEVAVLLDEIVAAVVRSATLAGVHGRRWRDNSER